MTELELMEKYEKKLNEAYARANTKSKKKRVARDLITFSSLCYEHFGIDKDYDWERDYSLIELLEDYDVKFVENTMANTILYENIFKKTLNTFIDIKFPFYKDYYKDYGRMTDLEFQDVIFSFLKSYDPKLLSDFRTMLDSGNVFGADLDECQGFTCPIESLNKNFMFFADYQNNVGSAAIIAHEYGHCYEIKNYFNTGAKNYFDKTYQTPYYEISSKFFEYAFLNYLKENNIYVKDTDIRLNIYYIDLLINAFNINLLSYMKKIEINENGRVVIDDDEVVKICKETEEKLNYYDIGYDKNKSFSYRDSYIYGIGAITAIYLYENYKQDPNNFKKEFRNSLLLYTNNGIEAFERVGVTPEILTEGKVLRKVLEDSK